MNTLIKITMDDDYMSIPLDEQVWHIKNPASEAGDMILCTGEFYGYGESSVEFEEKQCVRGGITCQRCLDAISQMKSIKL